jgi:hypothetical protein
MYVGVDPREFLSAAEQRARELSPPPAPVEPVLDRLRADCVRFFTQTPEPPVYRRAEDPARDKAAALVPQAQELYTRCLWLDQATTNVTATQLAAAMRAHLTALCHTAAGKLEAAEEAWREACALERSAASARRLWVRSDEAQPPVYDPETGTSRYDPRPEPHVRVKLACVQSGCQKVDEYAFSPRYATHRFDCPECKVPFIAYFGELRSVEVEDRAGQLKHYRFRLEEVGGGCSRVEFDEASGAELAVARGDLLAFLYTDSRELRAVLNLSTSRLLWVHRGGCFVATVAFGVDAPELHAFRAYRDRVLLHSVPGRLFVRAYYDYGPALAAGLKARPRALSLVRGGLRRLHRELLRSGYR